MENTYRVTEFNNDTCKPTGKVEYYLAPNIDRAVTSCLYTHRSTTEMLKSARLVE